jgi:hypothetical protein
MQKAFRSYTNPTAAKMLFDELGVGKVVVMNPGVSTYNQYVFAKPRDDAKVEKNKKLFSRVNEHFPDGKMYHGTKSRESLRSILLQNILPSIDGLGGAGLYVVPESNIRYAEERAGDKDQLVYFTVSNDAVLVDVTEGPGKKAWEKFQKEHEGTTLDAFAEEIGADIVKYPFSEGPAYVVKNSTVLGRAQGHTIQIAPLWELEANAKKVKTAEELARFVVMAQFNGASTDEILAMAKHADTGPLMALAKDLTEWSRNKPFTEAELRLLGPALQIAKHNANWHPVALNDALLVPLSQLAWTHPAKWKEVVTAVAKSADKIMLEQLAEHGFPAKAFGPLVDALLAERTLNFDEVILRAMNTATAKKCPQRTAWIDTILDRLEAGDYTGQPTRFSGSTHFEDHLSDSLACALFYGPELSPAYRKTVLERLIGKYPRAAQFVVDKVGYNENWEKIDAPYWVERALKAYPEHAEYMADQIMNGFSFSRHDTREYKDLTKVYTVLAEQTPNLEKKHWLEEMLVPHVGLERNRDADLDRLDAAIRARGGKKAVEELDRWDEMMGRGCKKTVAGLKSR